jgi:hypothetical protein
MTNTNRFMTKSSKARLLEIVPLEELTGTISYLLSKGQALHDGDTLGSTDDELIDVKLFGEGDRPAIPDIRLRYRQS